jgi:UDP-N-acetylmuramoylalanine--D-glutamate ligase
VKKRLESFKGLKHRFEIIATMHGTQYINDSKATSPDATQCALNSVRAGCILLLQGVPLKNCEEKLTNDIKNKCTELHLIGSMKPLFINAFDDVSIRRWDSIEDCFEKHDFTSHHNTDILLSPSAPSYDQFKNYEERGDVFTEQVKRMIHSS